MRTILSEPTIDTVALAKESHADFMARRTKQEPTATRSSYLVELITDEECHIDCYAAIRDNTVTCADRASVYVSAPDLFTGKRPYCSAQEHLVHAEWMVGV